MGRADIGHERVTSLAADQSGEWMAVQTPTQVLFWKLASLNEGDLTPAQNRSRDN